MSASRECGVTMYRDASHRLLMLAFERGLISRDELDEALAQDQAPDPPASSWGAEVEALVRDGVLEPSQIVRLVRDLPDEGDGSSSIDDHSYLSEEQLETIVTGADTPAGSLDRLDPFLDIALDPVVVNWERYEIGELLGQGGMGCVYRARDTQLDRDVALKFLRRDDPEQIRRFRREARSQAKVDHPNVCRVYEVGEIGRHVYIAMQHVRGQSLTEAGLTMSLPEKVAAVRDVARAIHAAHDSNLIHRDLKPANIMVERRREGWHPYVLDFGIAREQQKRDVTETGMVMGTLTYLSPEQARGEVAELDRRSDVYGLGATMYALFAGCPPFPQTAGAEIVWRVVNEEPRPLRRRDPDIPAELETIVMKCLEKEVERRYQSARDLADDLDRFLQGEPIRARRSSLLYRAIKKISKHRAMATVVGAALVVVIAAVAANLHTLHQTRVRRALDHRLTQEVNQLEKAARIQAMLPLHDRSSEREHIRVRMERIRGSSAHLGDAATGPVNYALGRVQLLLGNDLPALEHLLAAWDAGYREPTDAYALGRVYTSLYRKGLEELQQIDNAELRTARQEEIEARYRDPALQHLKMAGELGIEAPAYAEGLIGFLEGRYDEALAKARQAFGQVGWMYEAKELEGDIDRAIGLERLGRGDFDGARQASRKAAEAYATALGIARSESTLHESECSRWLLEMEIAMRTGEDAETPFNQALASCGDALKINPESVSARTRIANANWRRAELLTFRGHDPGPSLDAALTTSREAVELDPDDLHAHYNLGCTLSAAGVHQAAGGLDPRPSFERAIAAFERAIEISPVFTAAFDDMGYAYERSSKYELEHGIDPSESVERAISAYRSAIQLTPSFANAHNNLGIAFLRRGVYASLIGDDPEESFAEALASFERAVDINPNYASAHANMGFLHQARAQHLNDRGLDPLAAVAAARAAFDRAAVVNPSLSWTYPERAAAELVAARWIADGGQDPGRALGRAQRAVDTALRLNPAGARAWLVAARLELERARWARRGGTAAPRRIAEGLRMARKAQGLNPALADAVVTRAELLVEQNLIADNRPPSSELEHEIRALLERAVELNPLLERRCATVVAALRARQARTSHQLPAAGDVTR